MHAHLGSKKQHRNQKTYGKSVKSHPNGVFGRNLWTEIESADDAVTVRQRQLNTKDMRHTKSASATSKDIISNTASLAVEEAIKKEPSCNNVESVMNQLQTLGISDDASITGDIDCQRSIVTSDPSTSLVRNGAVEENETCLTHATKMPLVPSQIKPPSNTWIPDIIEESNFTKDSLPRKCGVRKRLSAVSVISNGSAVSSPLKNELSNNEDELQENNNSINQWEDGPNKFVIAEEHSIRNVVDNCITTASTQGDVEQVNTLADRLDGLAIAATSTKQFTSYESILSWQNNGKRASIAADSSVKRINMSETFGLSGSPCLCRSPQAREVTSASEVQSLLQLCCDQNILDFTALINSMLQVSTIRKLGEASYSEVFLLSGSDSESSTVLKVIPFGQEDQCEVKSLVQEVRITKIMAEVEGFIGFRGAFVVKGHFPEELMAEWDSYDEQRVSENERPDFYEKDQLFAIIMLENGGTSLEHTELRSWEEAVHVFWQVAFALARGEKERHFEHRDLHFGNIVLRRERSSSAEKLENSSLGEGSLTYPELPLKAALIDYTLSRACCSDWDSIEYMQLDDPALFSGKGDYQFDIYRFMRDHVSSGLVTSGSESIDWKVYAPRTNVFWLHYLATILLTKMGIPRPISRGRNAVSQKEREFFKQLETLARAIDTRHKKFKKSVDIESSQKLVEWAVAEGIIATGI